MKKTMTVVTQIKQDLNQTSDNHIDSQKKNHWYDKLLNRLTTWKCLWSIREDENKMTKAGISRCKVVLAKSQICLRLASSF